MHEIFGKTRILNFFNVPLYHPSSQGTYNQITLHHSHDFSTKIPWNQFFNQLTSYHEMSLKLILSESEWKIYSHW